MPGTARHTFRPTPYVLALLSYSISSTLAAPQPPFCAQDLTQCRDSSQSASIRGSPTFKAHRRLSALPIQAHPSAASFSIEFRLLRAPPHPHLSTPTLYQDQKMHRLFALTAQCSQIRRGNFCVLLWVIAIWFISLFPDLNNSDPPSYLE
jgi:hypothetical protein